MGLPSVLIAYITVYVQDASAVKLHGFFGGYKTIVWTVIVVQAVGGLIVATVVKVSDFIPTGFPCQIVKTKIGSHLYMLFPFFIFLLVCRQCIESICNVFFNHHFMYYIGILV